MRGLAGSGNFSWNAVPGGFLGISVGMRGLAAIGNFSWNAGPGGLWEFQLECGDWRPLGILAGMRGLAAFGDFSWVATASYPGVIPVTTPPGCTFSYPTQTAGPGGLWEF
jgi:hypothetical protein